MSANRAQTRCPDAIPPRIFIIPCSGFSSPEAFDRHCRDLEEQAARTPGGYAGLGFEELTEESRITPGTPVHLVMEMPKRFPDGLPHPDAAT